MVAVIGIIAVISIVSLKGARPDREALMVRKAYTELSKAVYAIANDEELYPSAQVALNDFAGKQFLSKEDLAKIVNSINTSHSAAYKCFCSEVAETVLDNGGETSCETEFGWCRNGESICDESKGYYKQSNGTCQKTGSSSSGGKSTSTSTGNSSGDCSNIAELLECGLIDLTNCTCLEQHPDRNCTVSIAIACANQGGTFDTTTCKCIKNKDDDNKTSTGSSNGGSGDDDNINTDDPSTSSGNGNGNNGGDIGIGTGNYNGFGLDDGNYSDSRYVLASGTNVFGDTTVYNGANYQSNYKFAYNIGKTMKGKDLNCNNRTCTFTTSDGMYWKIEDNMNNGGYAYVNVDINGSKGSRSMTSSAPDLYPFVVDVSGHVSVGGKDIVNNASVSDSTMAVEKAKA
ncbi:hypothetical protein IJ843_00670, partial [bacterium]|nr:hypothetical protein [bacterium]